MVFSVSFQGFWWFLVFFLYGFRDLKGEMFLKSSLLLMSCSLKQMWVCILAIQSERCACSCHYSFENHVCLKEQE